MPIHYVEGLPCYVVGKKIHQIENPPENLEKYELYSVKRDGVEQVELVMEE